MSEFDFLRKNKGEQVLFPTSESYGLYFTLNETNPDCPYSIKINQVPSDSILIKVDENRFDVQGVFSGRGSCDGICKKGDYILISEEDKKIIFIELKYGSKSIKHITQQLIGIECIWNYICSLITHYCNQCNWMKRSPFDEYEICYFSIKNIGKGSLKRPDRHLKREKTSLENIGIISGQNEILYKNVSY